MCGCILQKRTCDNKEIRKEYVEDFVLSELEKNTFNDKEVLILVEKTNLHIQEQVSKEKVSAETMLKELEDIDK